MKEWTVVFYRQYGQWSVTVPFPNRAEAEKHVALNLVSRGEGMFRVNKDHMKDITYVSVSLPE